MLIPVYADIKEKEKKVILSPIQGNFSKDDLDTLKRLGWKGTSVGTLISGYDTYNASKAQFKATESEALTEYLKFLDEASRAQLEAVEKYLNEECPFKLFQFQKEWVRWFCDPLQTRYAAMNACEPGLGKTVQTLASIMAINKEAAMIILCPKNAVGVWIEHLDKFQYQLPVRVGKLEPCKGACILTYESLNPEEKEANAKKRFLEDFLRDIPKGTILVADEFHKTKSKNSLMSKRFRKLFKLVKKKEGKCIALTATPIMSYQDDLKQLLMNLDLFNITFGKADVFNELYGGTFNWATKRVDWDPNNRKPEEIQKRVKSCIFLRKKKDVIDQLPEKITTYITLDIPIGKENNKQLDLLLDNINGLSKDDISSYQKIRHNLSLVKSKLALETIEEYEASEKPIIVFSDFKDPINDLGKRPGWRCITGDTDPKDRTIYVKEMNDKKLKGLAITIGAGNNAISLPEVDTALFIDLSLTTGNNYQARNRNDRISNVQEKIHYIYFTINHPFEKKMYELLLEKEEINTDTFGTT